MKKDTFLAIIDDLIEKNQSKLNYYFEVVELAQERNLILVTAEMRTRAQEMTDNIKGLKKIRAAYIKAGR